MLGTDLAKSGQISKLRDHLIDEVQFPKSAVCEADLNPCDFLLYYVKNSLRAAASLAEELSRIEPHPDSQRMMSSYDWERNSSNHRGPLQSSKSISRHLGRNHTKSSHPQPRLATILYDYDQLIEETRENHTQLQSLSQIHTSQETIKETQKSLEQADAVRR